MRQLRIEMQAQIRSIVGILSLANLIWEFSRNSGRRKHCFGRFSEIDIASEHPYRRRELLREAFSKLSYRVARV